MGTAQILTVVLSLMILEHTHGQSDTTHKCIRPCTRDEEGPTQPLVCEYNFTIEWYLTMSKACFDCPFVESDCYRPHCIPGDGNRRALIAVNRQFPAPTIEVCEGDTVKVHVYNNLVNGEGTTIHWHGIHQKGTPYMDGTNMVTQCPISEQSTFTYEFEASPSGTHIYHAHTGFQMADGLFGMFIIHAYEEDEPAYELYDHDCDTPHGHCEHKVALNDWMTETYLERWTKLRHNSFDSTLPVTALINGRMSYFAVENETEPLDIAYTPYTVFEMEEDKRYRYRLSGEGHLPCAFKFSVDGHSMLIISKDGRPVEPVDVDALIVYSGERYDFVLIMMNETDSTDGNFWMKAHATNFCRDSKPNAYAIVRYAWATVEDPVEDPEQDRGEGYLLQPIMGDANPDDLKYQHGEPWDINVDELDSTTDEDFTDEIVDATHYLELNNIYNDNSRYHHAEFYSQDMVAAHKRTASAVINNITFLLPPVPVLSQPNDLDPSLLCDRFTVDMSTCENNLCHCVHAISLAQDQVVEIVLVNVGGTAHPMHMHGYTFRMMGTERISEEISLLKIQQMNENGELKKKSVNPPYADTVTVHALSYVVVRFKTDNPGYWLFHCHLTNHLGSGQIVLMSVGEHSVLPAVPEGFPRCGDWSPAQRPSPPVTTTTPSAAISLTMSGWVLVAHLALLQPILA